jgi:hypothetical protein
MYIYSILRFFCSLAFIANMFGMENPAKKQCVKPTVEYHFTLHEAKEIRYFHDALNFNKACNDDRLSLAMPFISIVIKNSSGILPSHQHLSLMAEGQFLQYQWCLCCDGVPLSYVLQKEFVLEMADARYRFIKDMSMKEEEMLAARIQEFERKPSLRSILKDNNKNLLEAGVVEWDEKSCWYKHGPNSYFALKKKEEEEKRMLLLQRLIPYTTLNFATLTLLASYQRS